MPSMEPAKNHDTHMIVREWLSDLDADQPMVRIAAMMQLQQFLHYPGVRDGLSEYLSRENNEECRLIGYQILGISKDAQPEQAAFCDAFSDDLGSLLSQLPQIHVSRIPDLREHLGKLNPGIVNSFLDKAFSADLSVPLWEMVISISLSSEPMFHHARVQKLVNNGSAENISRGFSVLVINDPGFAYRLLPKLLLHRYLTVRVMAVRTLHKVFPTEAVRILREMVSSEHESHRIIGISLMFIFPFAEISSILITALESGTVPQRVVPFVVELVRNNPDSAFMARLAELVCLRGEDFDIGLRLMKVTAESLLLIGREKIPTEELTRKFLSEARLRVDKILSVSVAPDGKAFEKSEITEIIPGIEKAPDKERLTDRAIVADSQGSLPQLPSDPTSEDLRILALWMEKSSENRDDVLQWLSLQLESKSADVVILTMELLSKHAPKKMLPHLPVLCFHKNPIVMNQALRHFRRLNASAFLLKIQLWINGSANSTALQAALAGLAQMKFAQATELILRVIRRTSQISHLENFSNLLLLNPEPEVLKRLQEMERASSGDKKAFLHKLIDQYRENLKLTGQESKIGEGIELIFSKDQIDSLLEQVRNAHFFEQSFPASLGSLSPSGKMLFVGGILMLAWLAWPWLVRLINLKSDATSGNMSAMREIQRLPPRLTMNDSDSTGRLLYYDSNEDIWLLKLDDGGVFQIAFNGRPSGLKNQIRITVKTAKSDRRYCGRPVYSVLSHELH